MDRTGHSTANLALIAGLVLLMSGSVFLAMEQEVTCIGQPPSHLYVLYGYVFDPDGEKVQNATIEIENPETGEVLTARTNENGSYSRNLGNFQEGWEEGQEIIVSAIFTVSESVSIHPHSEDGGEEVNVTLPGVMFVSPVQGDVLDRKTNAYPLEVRYFPGLSVSKIIIYVDSEEYLNSTTTNTTLYAKSLGKGEHTLRVELISDNGTMYSKEITIEAKGGGDDDSYLDPGMIVLAFLATVYLYRRT